MPAPQPPPAPVTTSALAPLRIEIGGSSSSVSFKSIDSLVWDDIPSLAVLTGLNGSGKTQLLELLAYKLTGTPHPTHGDLSQVQLAVTGDKFDAGSVAYLPSRWDIAN